jgi:hypothetical protein
MFNGCAADPEEDEEEPVKDYAARHPLVLELLSDVRPFYPGADPKDQPQLFPALVVEVCLGAAWQKHVTGYVDVDGVRYYTVDETALQDITWQLDTNVTEEDGEWDGMAWRGHWGGWGDLGALRRPAAAAAGSRGRRGCRGLGRGVRLGLEPVEVERKRVSLMGEGAWGRGAPGVVPKNSGEVEGMDVRNP